MPASLLSSLELAREATVLLREMGRWGWIHIKCDQFLPGVRKLANGIILVLISAFFPVPSLQPHLLGNDWTTLTMCKGLRQVVCWCESHLVLPIIPWCRGKFIHILQGKRRLGEDKSFSRAPVTIKCKTWVFEHFNYDSGAIAFATWLCSLPKKRDGIRNSWEHQPKWGTRACLRDMEYMLSVL